MNQKYSAHSTEKYQSRERYQPDVPPRKRKGPSIGIVLFFWFAVMVCGITIILIVISPKSAETKKTLDNTLVPDVAIFSTEKPTGTPTNTPTATSTPEPTIDFEAAQQSLDAERTRVTKLTQEKHEKDLYQYDIAIKQAELDEAFYKAELTKLTLTFAEPMATETRQAKQTQDELDYAATTTPQAIKDQKEIIVIKRNDFFTTVIIWIIISVGSLFFCGLSFALYKAIWNNMITKPQEKNEIDNKVKEYEETEKAKARAVEFADQSKQLLGLIEESINKYGGNAKKIIGHRDIDWLTYPQWSALINLMKISNRIFEKRGGNSAKGFYLTYGTLDKFFEEIAAGQFPPPGSVGRSD